jgi:hypothetical protein
MDTASHLLDAIRVYESAVIMRDAAEELSYVTDPIAVHYLARASEVNESVDDAAIRGLERIGNDEARQVLERMAAGRRYDSSRWARGALDRLNAKRK